MARAARTGDLHVCTHDKPHVHTGGPVSSGCTSVMYGDELAARVGDRCHCEGGLDDVIAQGCLTVIIAGRRAARSGDKTHGGFLSSGMKTVRIGQGSLSNAIEGRRVTRGARAKRAR